MKKITVLGIFNVNNGITSFVKNNYSVLKRKYGLEFNFINISNARPAHDLSSLGAYYEVTQFGKGRKLIKHIQDLRHVYAEVRQNSDVIHIHLDSLHNPLPIMLAHKAGFKRIIVHSHSDHRGQYSFIKEKQQELGRYLTSKYATDWIACSQNAADFFYSKKTQQKKNFKIIVNGINLKKFSYSPELDLKFRSLYRIEENATVIGHVGRFLAEKNHDFLVKAFAEFLKKDSNAVLMLIGNGDHLSDIKRLVANMGLKEHVLFTDFIDNVAEVQNVFDVFALPSLYEGLSLSLLENLANGTPAVLSPNQSEESFSIGKTYKVSLDSPIDWADKFLQLTQKVQLSSKKESSLLNRKEMSQKGFTLESTVRALKELYC